MVESNAELETKFKVEFEILGFKAEFKTSV